MIFNTIIFEPRVMRHQNNTGSAQFAIHEVYFDEKNQVVSYTTDALSPKADSINDLKQTLIAFIKSHNDMIVCGELNYEYSKSDIQMWLENIDRTPLDYQP